MKFKFDVNDESSIIIGIIEYDEKHPGKEIWGSPSAQNVVKKCYDDSSLMKKWKSQEI